MDINKVFAISGLLNSITAISLGFVVLFNDRKKFSNIIFWLFTFSVGIWSLGYYFWLSTTSREMAGFWFGILNIGSTFIPIFYYHWITVILGNDRKKILRLGYIITFAFSLFSFTKLYFTDLTPIAGFRFWPQAGPVYIYYVVILYGGFFLLGVADVIRVIMGRYEKKIKSVAKFILAASLISMISGATNFPLWFGVEILPYGNFVVFIYIFLFSYAMARHNLMSMKSASIYLAIIFILVISAIEIFTSVSTYEVILRVPKFLVILFFSYLLYRSTSEEIKRKEELQVLSDKLANANEQLKKLDRAKSEFISIASHQLRTPLTSIKGYISLVIEGTYGKIDKKVKEALSKVYVSNERLIQLVENLLNISRIESGKIEYKYDDWQIEKIISELTDNFIFAAKKKKLYLHLDLPKHPLPMIRIDGPKVREVISNVIDNAIKYTEKGGITVKAEQARDKVRVIVYDTGIGIPKEEIPYVFAKFSRGKDTGRLQASGTGLGMYVGKSLIEAQNGKIWVESKGDGKGSRFIIELPIKQEGASEKRTFSR